MENTLTKKRGGGRPRIFPEGTEIKKIAFFWPPEFIEQLKKRYGPRMSKSVYDILKKALNEGREATQSTRLQ